MKFKKHSYIFYGNIKLVKHIWCLISDCREKASHWTHSEEEGELPAVEPDPEELGLQTLLLHNVVVISCLHFLHTHTEEDDDDDENQSHRDLLLTKMTTTCLSLLVNNSHSSSVLIISSTINGQI